MGCYKPPATTQPSATTRTGHGLFLGGELRWRALLLRRYSHALRHSIGLGLFCGWWVHEVQPMALAQGIKSAFSKILTTFLLTVCTYHLWRYIPLGLFVQMGYTYHSLQFVETGDGYKGAAWCAGAIQTTLGDPFGMGRAWRKI